MIYEFGNCALDTAKRQLTRSGDAVPLAPKTFDLLLLLVESGGRALSRSDVMQALWPDTFVEEANLSFQVSTLRKALGDDGAKWIETVPKHGYRFAGTLAPKNEQPAVARRRPTYWWIMGAGLMLAAVAGLLLVRKQSPGVGSMPRIPVPLTAYPGIQSHPTLSPDGSQVAFSWNGPNEDNSDIYVKLVGPGDPIRLTTDAARDFTPAWSPDGRQIAFLRFASRQLSAILVIPALGGGVERKVADIETSVTRWDANLAWTRDGKYIAAGGRFRGEDAWGIWLIPLDGGPPSRLTTANSELPFDSAPAFSPDGRSLAFIRVFSSTSSDLYVQSLTPAALASGDPFPVTSDRGPVVSAAWVDNRRIAYCVGRGPAQRRIKIAEPGSGHNPETLGFGEGAVALSVANGNLIYERQQNDANLWRFDVFDSAAKPQRLAPSTYQSWTPAFSHDGKRLAFASTRGGLEEIWVADADGGHPIQLTRIGTGHTANPRWSPDDRVLVFNSWNTRSQLYTVNVGDGSVKRLTDEPANHVEPTWSRDGKWIYCGSNRTGRLEIHRMPAEGGPLVQITRNGGLHAEESADRKWLYYSKNADLPSSIWKVPRDGGEENLAIAGLSYSTNFMPVEKGIWFVLGTYGPLGRATIEFYDFATATSKVLTSIDKPFAYGLAVSPDGRYLVHALMDHLSSNLMLVENFR